MLSEESIKLETYTDIKTKQINKLKNTNLFVDLLILKYFYSLCTLQQYIYMYVCLCVCVCVCVCVCMYILTAFLR